MSRVMALPVALLGGLLTVAAPGNAATVHLQILYSFTGGTGCGGNGCGIVSKLSSTGVETVLHKVTGEPDGAEPQSGLALSKGLFFTG